MLLSGNTGTHKKSSSDVIILDMAELDADPSRLAVEALTSSLFGSDPVIRIRGGNKNLVPVLEELLKSQLMATIVIQAANLTKRDKLRILIENEKKAWALPCFSDDIKSLKELIEKSFKNEDIFVSPEAISYLTSILGNDRDITRRELEKLHNFALQSKQISLSDVHDLCGDNSMVAIDKILDAAGTGNVQNLEKSLDSAFIAGLDAQMILAAGSRHFMFLRTVRAKIDHGASPSGALSQTYPKPHFSRNFAIEVQLRNWSQKTLANAIQRLLDTTLTSRQNSAIAQVIVRRAFLGICIAAARR
ncbi:MAG: hypothetical protein L3J21_01030 [Devosiaceae bacterium]|nr:hypothetical protein [Devosiaceae bacterium]